MSMNKQYSMTSEILEVCTVYREVRVVCVCVCMCMRRSGKALCILKQVNKNPMPAKFLLLPVKVPGGIGLNGRLSSPVFSLFFIFLKTANLLFSSFLFLPFHH